MEKPNAETPGFHVFFSTKRRPYEPEANTPVLQHSGQFVQAEPFDSDHAQRTWNFISN